MTVQPAELVSASIPSPRGGPFLGLRTVIGKEFSEWVRGPKALIILGVSVLGAVFMTLIPFIAEATNEAQAAGILSHDPTANVLLGWTGQTVALIAILATMALVSIERDRGTLGWTLTNPVSPTSVISAKFIVAFVVFVAMAVLLPMLISVGLATVLYGLPDLRVIGTFFVLFMALPAFYIALTVALGAGVKSTVGVAGIAFAVLFLPQVIGGLLPIVNELSPTSIGSWAMNVAKGQPASMLTPIGWAVSMVVLIVGAKLVFDRQEL
jgi:ABC-type transport system involved in multi-copper enzyme maturation permease subunit